MTADAHDFYERRVPAQWNRSLDAQHEAGQSDEDAARVAKAMSGVDATIRVCVRDAALADGEQVHHLNIASGRMTAAPESTTPPFLTLAHDLAAFEVLERESGDSVLGFLGGLAGLEGELKLTAGRMQNLAGLEGTLLFELTGEGGFALTVHFGTAPIALEPRCTLKIAHEAYEELRSGKLNPQDAFMSGQIQAEGDMQMAMQLALAAMTPD